MKESAIENRLRSEVEARGGFCVKLNPTNVAGIPDRLVVLPQEPVRFVELKKPKGSRTAPLQLHWEATLAGLGQPYSRLYTLEQVNELMAMYDRRARK